MYVQYGLRPCSILVVCGILLFGCKLDDIEEKSPKTPLNAAQRLIVLSKDPTYLCDNLVEAKGGVQALPVCLELAHADNVHAQARLGALYINGSLGKIDLSQGLYWLLRAANQNHPQAQYLVAKAYQAGEGLPQDDSQALFWLIKSSEANYAKAQIQLGLCYLIGRGITRNAEQAEKWLLLGAHEDFDLIFDLGHDYFQGKGVTKDITIAMQIFFYLAEKKHTKSMIMLGDIYRLNLINDPSPEGKAYFWYNQAIIQYDPSAHYHIAMIILNEKWSAPWDPILLLTSSARQKYAPAQRELAKLYHEGIKVARDETQALQLFQEASKYDGEACYHLGLAYLNGDLSLEKNKKLAALYLKAGAQTDYYPAKYVLASQFIDDENFLEDKFKAVEYLQPAAYYGVTDAQVKLAKILMKFSLPQYDEAAFHWILQASNHDSQAKYLLGCCHYEGIGTKVDYSAAVQIFYELSTLGDILSEFKLGQMLYYGQGIDKNKSLGKSKILHAAKFGVIEAKNFVLVLLEEEERSKKADLEKSNNSAEDDFEDGLASPESKEWIEFVAQHADPKIIYRQGVNHLFGKNAYSQNIPLGLKFIHQAAENEYILAQRQLGIIYEQGMIGTPDICKAHDWYLIAAKNGDNYSQYRLANLYYTGFGGEKNYIQSYAWADRALHGGKADAIFLREKIAAQLNVEELNQAQYLSNQYSKMARKNNE